MYVYIPNIWKIYAYITVHIVENISNVNKTYHNGNGNHFNRYQRIYAAKIPSFYSYVTKNFRILLDGKYRICENYR